MLAIPKFTWGSLGVFMGSFLYCALGDQARAF